MNFQENLKKNKSLFSIPFMLTIIVSLLLFLSSCIGVESSISFNDNGSGILTLNYRISKMIINLGETGEKNTLSMPLPVSEDDFRKSIAGIEGLKLRSFKQSENEDDILINATISFDDVSKLSKIKNFNEFPVSLEKRGERTYFKQKIASRTEEELDQQTMKMVDTFFEGYKIQYTVKAPREILSYNMGVLSPDKKTLSFETSITELLKTDTDIILEAAW